MVEQASRGADDDLGALGEGDDLGPEGPPADDRDHPHAGVPAGRFEVAGHLQAELTGGDDHEGLDVRLVLLDALDDRDAEGEGLAGAGARLADQVDAGERQRQAEGLDGEGMLDADPGQ